VKKKVDRWDENDCDNKGGGGKLPELARQFVAQRPVLGSGVLSPVLPAASAMTATTVATAAGGAVVTVGVGYLIYRGIRLLPSLFPPLWWTIPENLAIP
jgi:hypothetical protein